MTEKNYIAVFHIPEKYKIGKGILKRIIELYNQNSPRVDGFDAVCIKEGTRIKVDEDAFLSWYRKYAHEELDRELDTLAESREEWNRGIRKYGISKFYTQEGAVNEEENGVLESRCHGYKPTSVSF